eukprot:scaffold66937_cov45-Phaeocystis_antarctica.AAC.2
MLCPQYRGRSGRGALGGWRHGAGFRRLGPTSTWFLRGGAAGRGERMCWPGVAGVPTTGPPETGCPGCPPPNPGDKAKVPTMLRGGAARRGEFGRMCCLGVHWLECRLQGPTETGCPGCPPPNPWPKTKVPTILGELRGGAARGGVSWGQGTPETGCPGRTPS